MMSDISERLLNSIAESGFSYGDLAHITGIPKSAIQRYATGETEKIPLDRIQKLSAALGVSAAYIMGWEPEEAMVKMTVSTEELATQQREALFLELLRKLSPQQQEMILAQLQGLVHIQTGQGFL